jgi:hypothetical protein
VPSGLFAVNNNTGAANTNIGWRVVERKDYAGGITVFAWD